MTDITIERYCQHSMEKQWNVFVQNSKNSTFLINRNFMDYHSDRFVDHSLIFKRGQQIVALLPANEKDGELNSHGGLTFGGLIIDHTMRQETMILLFKLLNSYLLENGFRKLIYKCIPSFFHKRPAEEDLYAFFINKCTLIKREASSGIEFSRFGVTGKKANGAKKSIREGVGFRETDSAEAMMNICSHNLENKYDTQPVHTSNEIEILKKKNKKNVFLFELFDIKTDEVIGGAVIFLNDVVIHTQYLITNDDAKRRRGLDLLVCSIIDHFSSSCSKLSFGISTEDDGKVLNHSLMKQKEEYGASTFCHDTYEIVPR
ncbi:MULTISPECIES: GNAT family N-acetyltransferase [unclassified Colwellia]|uniref:GNAT family N-acetyltransferase n=1 Tax=unclassified Colwellia TaxID=196834 RepID=UPI0015F5027B|nr:MULTISPECIES: GNAT family N-acetyltransferase [unclassified Colwellia]MBA6233485.1 GNAT family N-acetyltransferase [Colwellia sp. MB02u-7]MBA6236575.1 GNAT family N-acetyltransferase [Colwellia sp. MB02u-11]MBA6298026.1 GNAT family N-acetyltransferase [Colwellia sp. MB3u-22]MBA6312150.1 GNAT family N-acetyltransferase [Colwellia sp. MB3u-64]